MWQLITPSGLAEWGDNKENHKDKIVGKIPFYQIGNDDQSENTVSMRKLNTKLATDCRVKTVMINIGDGYTLVTKL